MTKEEWIQQVQRLQSDENEYHQYDAGYTSKQKEEFSRQRPQAISKIKIDLSWSPFAKIAQEVPHSSWDFDECFDIMDGDMERTICEATSRNFELYSYI